jgi:S-adenosylmethionine:tRNA ribosyltransferase-isomerase
MNFPATVLLYSPQKSTQFTQLPLLLKPHSLIVFNETKVIQARIVFQKPSGGRIEIFCLEPVSDQMLSAGQKGTAEWYCLIGGASKWKTGNLLEKKIPYKNSSFLLQVRYLRKENDRFVLSFEWSPPVLTFFEVLEAIGEIPLPPYLKRATVESDKIRYQTVYAKKEGSVAAPTAGLHFTPEILKELQERAIESGFLTLHVGAGTFKPVQCDRIGDHPMHAESIYCPIELLYKLKKHGRDPIVAVGTTCLRSLESIYLIGVKAARGLLHHGRLPEVTQWEAYESADNNIETEEAIEALIEWMEKQSLDTLQANTRLLIAPGFRFHVVNQLITNFHQPGSTLLLLVAAFVGDDWKKIYQTALEKDFRFLSYGDSSLLERS